MFEGLFDVDSLIRIKDQHLFEQIQNFCGRLFKDIVEITDLFLAFADMANHVNVFFRDVLDVVEIRWTQNLADELDLFFSAAAREKRFA